MHRQPEPELMDDAVQAAAYAQGDFAAAHQFLVDQAGRLLGDLPPVARALGIGIARGADLDAAGRIVGRFEGRS